MRQRFQVFDCGGKIGIPIFRRRSVHDDVERLLFRDRQDVGFFRANGGRLRRGRLGLLRIPGVFSTRAARGPKGEACNQQAEQRGAKPRRE